MHTIKTVLWGASGHAKSVSQALQFNTNIEIIGYLDDIQPQRRGQIFEGKKVLGGSEQLDWLKEQGITTCVLAFGHCMRRIEIGDMLIQRGFTVLPVVHPNATTASDVSMGDGVVVLAGAILDAGCRIGNYTIVNNGAVISHECIVGEGTHVCPGVQLAGQVIVGRGCWLGIGSTVIDKVNIGNHAFIGAGSVVTKDIPSGCLAYGNPAKIIRDIEPNF